MINLTLKLNVYNKTFKYLNLKHHLNFAEKKNVKFLILEDLFISQIKQSLNAKDKFKSYLAFEIVIYNLK